MNEPVSGDACPSCDHQRTDSGRPSNRPLLRRNRRARCSEQVVEADGWGSMPCDCHDPFHGS